MSVDAQEIQTYFQNGNWAHGNKYQVCDLIAHKYDSDELSKNGITRDELTYLGAVKPKLSELGNPDSGTISTAFANSEKIAQYTDAYQFMESQGLLENYEYRNAVMTFLKICRDPNDIQKCNVLANENERAFVEQQAAAAQPENTDASQGTDGTLVTPEAPVEAPAII